jgi:cobalamin synthase
MRNSTRGVVRWGSFGLEAYCLFVLYNVAFMVPFPFNQRLGFIAGAAAVSLAFAWFSSVYWENSAAGPRQTIGRAATKPPIVLWCLLVIPPAIVVALEILTYRHTGK